MDQEKKRFFDGVSPKFTFTFGLLIGLTIISTVAFFIVLFANMDETADAGNAKVVNINSAAAAPAPGEPEPIFANVSNIDFSQSQVRGDENAAITIVEYSDFECSYCSRFHLTMNQIIADYPNQVKWVWKHYPLSFHVEAEPAANAAECAGEQNKFWEYADELYENQSSLGDDLYTEIAQDLGLNMSSFNTCLTANKYADLFASDMSEGTALGISGTPGNIIYKNGSNTGEIIAGAYPYETVVEKIEALLE